MPTGNILKENPLNTPKIINSIESQNSSISSSSNNTNSKSNINKRSKYNVIKKKVYNSQKHPMMMIDMRKEENGTLNNKIYNSDDSFKDDAAVTEQMFNMEENRKESFVEMQQIDATKTHDALKFPEREDTMSDIEAYSQKKVIYQMICWRLLYSFLFLFIGIQIQNYFIILSDNKYETGETPLKDRVHEFFDAAPSFMGTSFINGSIFFIFVLTFIRFGIFCPFVLSLVILIRITMIISMVYFTRGFFIYVTTLPCPIPTCQPLRNGTFLENIQSSFYIIIAKVYECTDLIISGHTAFTTVLVFVWIMYEKNIFVNIFIILYAIFVYACIIISRFHYTVDVMMGCVFASTLFIGYHCMLDLAAKRYAVNKTFKKESNDLKSFFDRLHILNLIIQLIGKAEALNHRLEISMSYNKEWPSFCPCERVNSERLIVKKSTIHNETVYEFTDHFYHSYAGTGSYCLSTVRKYAHWFKKKLNISIRRL